jgi:PTS system cellobiose-specific IIB component
MQSILIVCGAGASSTFLASRMRAIAKARGLVVLIEPASDSDMRSKLHHSTVLLVGSHLSARFESLKAEAAEFGIPSALLPPTAFGPSAAEHALDLAAGMVTLESSTI